MANPQFDPTISLQELLERAANNAEEGITISSMAEPDMALIYLNEGFERLTGYERRDVIGRNCRFLQGDETDQQEVDKIRHAIKTGSSVTVELLNYRKDGSRFWNRLSLSPLTRHLGQDHSLCRDSIRHH